MTGSELPQGTTLHNGRYEVGKVVGRGGFAITYEGIDHKLQRKVAIKELFPEGCIRAQTRVVPVRPDIKREFENIKKKFLEEARILAKFNHPGIERVYDFFEENDTGYIIVEFLEGKTLGSIIKEKGKLEEQEALAIINDVCEALSVVHKSGYLHRDINPNNIFITEDGRVVLIDFGNAREYMIGKIMTHTVILTPGYAPLEQYSQVAERGPYTDIYALSATLYHMLTGQAPIDAPSRDAGTKLPSPREVNPSISEAVSRAVMAGLEMDYRKRPQSVEDFLSLLGIRGRKTLLIRSIPKGFGQVKLVKTLHGHHSRVWAVVFSPDGKLLASGSAINGVIIWDVKDGSLVNSYKNNSDWVLDFSPDGELLAAGSSERIISVWQLQSGKLLNTIEVQDGGVLSVAFSPDGSLLASASGNSAKVWRVKNGQLLATFPYRRWIRSVAFSPDGKLLAFCGGDNAVVIVELVNEEVIRELKVDFRPLRSVAFSPDGSLIASSGGGDNVVRIWRVDDGSLVRELKGHSGQVWRVTFSPDGELLASASDDKTIKIWKVSGGKLLQTLAWHQSYVLALDFSPDGKLLASGGADTQVMIWEIGD
ncbi:MAG: protein kinase domain-containing protein [bacterium]